MAASSTRNAQYDYVQSYNNKAPVVLISGLFAGDWIWQKTSALLIEQGFSVITLCKALAQIDPSIERLRMYIKGIVDELGHSQFILCGNSLGGLLALDLASHFPERVQSIIVSGAPGLGERVNLGLGTPMTATQELIAKLIPLLFYDSSCLTEEMVGKCYALVQDRTTVFNIFRGLRAARDYDVQRILPSIRCPVLLIWGENDMVTPVDEWERNLHLLEYSVMMKIPRCGHGAMLEKAEEFNLMLLQFLHEQETSGEHPANPNLKVPSELSQNELLTNTNSCSSRRAI